MQVLTKIRTAIAARKHTNHTRMPNIASSARLHTVKSAGTRQGFTQRAKICPAVNAAKSAIENSSSKISFGRDKRKSTE